MIERYDTLILGASFFGCGMASACKGRVLVLEESILPGSDFVLSLNPGMDYDSSRLRTDAAKELYFRLREVNAISSDGRVSLAGISEVMADWCLKRELPIFFGVGTVQRDEHHVVAVTAEGVREFEAERIVDARPKTGENKWLNVMIGAPAELPDDCRGPFEMRHSIIDGEFFLSFQAPVDSSWSEVRAMFHRAWDLRPVSLKNSTIMLTATRFDYRQYANPLQALDAGVVEAGR